MNKICKACKSNGHDSKGDHLWLMKDGETWICTHSEYHSNKESYFERLDGSKCKSPSHRDSTGKETVDEILSYPLVSFDYRGIRSEIYKLFETRVSYSEETGQPNYLYFPIRADGDLIGFQRRDLNNKSFINIGSIAGRTLDLFGYNLCAKTGKNIVITEGQVDALSVYQIIKDKYNKINPNIVSLNNGTGSIKDIGSSRSDLNNYDQILLSFDMDKPGRDAVAKVSKLLGSKIKVMELSTKDANEALTTGKGHEIINSLFNPRDYIPSDIVTLSDIYDQILEEVPYGIPFPWSGLTDLTYGIFSNQIISIGAGPGTGKTIFMNQLTSYLIKEHQKKIAIFSLEEIPSYTAKKLIGSLIQKRIHIPGVSVTKEEIQHEVEVLKDYLYIYDTQGFLSWEDIKNNIRYLSSLGCSYFIIDPLTAVTSMYSASEANELLNQMTSELSGIVQSLGITVFLVSHLNAPKTGKAHSEGGTVNGEQFTQSRALFRWSHLVLGLERNLQSEDLDEKNTMVVRVIKNRLIGTTGKISLYYDTDTGMLREHEQLEII